MSVTILGDGEGGDKDINESLKKPHHTRKFPNTVGAKIRTESK